MTKVVLSWSSGKDSAWALHVLRGRNDVEVVGLLTTLSMETERVAMHAVRKDLVRAQARAAQLPLEEVELPSPCSNEAYERAMAGAVERERARGVDAFAFGDLFLEDVRRYREERLRAVGMESVFPLWGADTSQLAREMTEAGLRAIVTCIDPRKLDRSIAGRVWNAALLSELPRDVDPCGEHGEMHTFAFDGPMFDRPIPVRVGQTMERDGFVYADLLPGDRPVERRRT